MTATGKTIQSVRSFAVHSLYQLGNISGINRHTATVLCYHDFTNRKDTFSVSPYEFNVQMRRLSENYRFSSADEIVKLTAITAPTVLPRVCITIDDGYESVLSVQKTIRSYRIPVLLFALAAPFKANRHELANRFSLLRVSQLRKLANSGFTIGSHSLTHPDFSRLNSREIHYEITHSKKLLEKALNRPVEYYAYPKGYVSDTLEKAVRSAGYAGAFATHTDTVTALCNPFRLPRITINRFIHSEEFPDTVSRSLISARKTIEKTLLGRWLYAQ